MSPWPGFEPVPSPLCKPATASALRIPDPQFERRVPQRATGRCPRRDHVRCRGVALYQRLMSGVAVLPELTDQVLAKGMCEAMRCSSRRSSRGIQSAAVGRSRLAELHA